MTREFVIRDEITYEEPRFRLYADGAAQALLRKRGGMVELVWQVYGPQAWPDAKVLLQGMLELSVIADQLSGEKK